jgi:hypothetical protein
LIILEYSYVVDKDKEEKFRKWNSEIGGPYFRSIPGLKEIRDYSFSGSNRKKSIIEMESYEALGKVLDNPEFKEITSKFAEFTHGLEWTMWEEYFRFRPE